MKLSIVIDGVEIKRPNDLDVNRYKISDLDRVLSGDNEGDYINKKTTFTLTYTAITTPEWYTIVDLLYEQPKMFYTMEIILDNIIRTYTVYPGALPSRLHMTGGEWVWKNISFQLIEK